MLASVSNIAVNPSDCHDCSQPDGEVDCSNETCNLCLPCLSNETVNNCLKSYREHEKKGGMQKIFPKAVYNKAKIIKTLSKETVVLVKWFKAKCDEDPEWC